jgi:hypothetical protein
MPSIELPDLEFANPKQNQDGKVQGVNESGGTGVDGDGDNIQSTGTSGTATGNDDNQDITLSL